MIVLVVPVSVTRLLHAKVYGDVLPEAMAFAEPSQTPLQEADIIFKDEVNVALKAEVSAIETNLGLVAFELKIWNTNTIASRDLVILLVFSKIRTEKYNLLLL